jgi:ABC-type phosphate transport system permease subunit
VNRRVLRRTISNFMVGLMIGAVIVALLPLFFILIDLVLKGASSLSIDFFTKTPAPAGETGGGVVHALVGTLMIVGMASLIGLPIGIGAGIYCAEYPSSRLTWRTCSTGPLPSWSGSSPGPGSSPPRSTSPLWPAV